MKASGEICSKCQRPMPASGAELQRRKRERAYEVGMCSRCTVRPARKGLLTCGDPTCQRPSCGTGV